MVELISLINTYPRISIILIGILITLCITLVNYFFTDKEKMRAIRARQKELQEQANKHRKEGNHEKASELTMEMLGQTREMFKHSLKPMLITLVPILLLFSYVRGIFSATSIAGSWFWYYFISAIVSSMVFRKLFNLP